MTEAAERGDVSVARKLWEYYLSRSEDDKAAPWEDRLIRAGYSGVIGHRSDTLFSEAYRLKDADPRKLALLKRSLDLEARYRKAVAGTVDHVMMNGKLEEIRFSGEPDEGTRRMQTLLARVEEAQSK
jgi:hypothetical protein